MRWAGFRLSGPSGCGLPGRLPRSTRPAPAPAPGWAGVRPAGSPRAEPADGPRPAPGYAPPRPIRVRPSSTRVGRHAPGSLDPLGRLQDSSRRPCQLLPDRSI
jgi:hypothetical protein